MSEHQCAVWKYQILSAGRSVISMQAGAKVLNAQDQRGVLTVWALVDPNASRERRCFYVAMTGEETPRLGDAKYIATVQLTNSILVVHIFEERAK